MRGVKKENSRRFDRPPGTGTEPTVMRSRGFDSSIGPVRTSTVGCNTLGVREAKRHDSNLFSLASFFFLIRLLTPRLVATGDAVYNLIRNIPTILYVVQMDRQIKRRK